jgi:LysM repeat protein
MLKGKHELKLVDYTVNPGENLWKISRDRNNFPVNLLLYFNDLNKLEQLYPGDIIKLPII